VTVEIWYNANGSVADTRNFSFDAEGNLLSVSNNNGNYSYTYDDSGRVLTVTNPFGQTLTYGYDQNGNVTSVSDSLGGQVTSVFSAAQRLTSRQFSGPNGQQARLDVAYTADGQVSTLTRYSNLSGTTKVGQTQVSYDAAGNLTHIQHQNGSNSTLLDLVYSYDAANRLSSQTVAGTTTNYGYDHDSQLTSAGDTSTSFDPNGNRTVSGYVTGVNNRLLSDGTWSYQYDAAGNITSKRNSQTGESWTYTVDLDNKQTSAVHKDASGNTLNSETLKYDAFGQLIEQDVTNGSTTATRFALDVDGNAWADLNGSNQLQMRRLYLDGANAVFARIDGSGNVSWYLADHLGSIVGLTNASGSLSDVITYDAWGNFSETQSANGDRDKFATYQYDVLQGDYFAQARRYNPATGRFEGIDPLGFSAGDDNLNRYTGNGPTNATDPSGLAPPGAAEDVPLNLKELQRLRQLQKAGRATGTPDWDGAAWARIRMDMAEVNRVLQLERLGYPGALGLSAGNWDKYLERAKQLPTDISLPGPSTEALQRRAADNARADAEWLHQEAKRPDFWVEQLLSSLVMPTLSADRFRLGADVEATTQLILTARAQGKFHPVLNPDFTGGGAAVAQYARDNLGAALVDGMILVGYISLGEGLLQLADRRAIAWMGRGTAPATAGSVAAPASPPDYSSLPARGGVLGRGGEGTVFELAGHPEWVLKEFKPGTVATQASNEAANLARLRSVFGDRHVVRTIEPPRRFAPGEPVVLLKERVMPAARPDLDALAGIRQTLRERGMAAVDVGNNLMWGTTAGGSTPRWIWIE
jgi:RHS repeat-associated protein